MTDRDDKKDGEGTVIDQANAKLDELVKATE